MKKLLILLALSLSTLSVGACAPYYQQNATARAEQYLSSTRVYITNKNYISAYWQAEQAIQYGTSQQTAQARELISGDDFGRGIESQILDNTNQYFNIDTIGEFGKLLSYLRVTNRYIGENYNSITAKMHENVKTQVLNGSVPVTFQDVERYDFLKVKEVMVLAYRNSVEKLKQETNPMLLEATLAMIQDPLCVSCESKFKKDSKSFKYDKAMTENTRLAGVVGSSAMNAAAQSIPALLISPDPNDRLMGLGVENILKNSDSIRVVASEGKGTYTAKIAKLAYEERVSPENTRTIVYDYFQCDPILSVLYMPRNASYMYEYVTSSASVEYAYEITLYKGKQKIADKLLRDTISDSTSYCRNARVQNVFGGVSPAAFVANPHMQSQCAGGSERTISPENMKASVRKALAGTIERMVLQQN